jgi:hypothetical protein
MVALMPTKTYPNGTGEARGSRFAVERPIYASSDIWYVNSATGTDAASPAGRNREAPLATLVQAAINAVAGDWIVLMEGHTETLSVQVTLAAKCRLVGGGKVSGKPGATIRCSAAGRIVPGANAQIHNVFFPERATSAATEKVGQLSADMTLIDCYFECGPNDTGAAVTVANNGTTMRGCTFKSVSTGSGLRPGYAIDFTGTMGPLYFDDLVIDGGERGFGNAAINAGNALDNISINNLSLLNGADVTLATGTTGHIHVASATGGSRVSW